MSTPSPGTPERDSATSRPPAPEHLLGALLDVPGALVLVLDGAGRIAHFNPACELVSGFASADVMGRQVWELLPESDAAAGAAEFQRLAAASIRHDAALSPTRDRVWRTRDGAERVIEWSRAPIRDADGRLAWLVSLGFDVTERRAYEASLATRDRVLATAQLVGQLGTWEWDAARDVVTWSDELRRIYGVPDDHAPSRAGYLGLVHPDDRAIVREVTGRALRDHEPFDYEVRIVRPDGGLRILRTTGEVALDGRRQPVRMFGTGQDVTERKYLEVRLRMAEKLEAVGRLAGGVAHDFNNLLTAVLGHADRLVAALPQGDPLRHDAEQVRRAAEQAALLTRQLLAFARKQMLEPRALDMNGVLTGLHDVLQRLVGESIELVTVPAARLSHVHADPGQIEQVVLDLVLRARDALSDGGRITLSVEDVTLDAESAMRFAPATAGAYVLLTVSDDGAGMSPDERARIFEPFYGGRPGERGSGLTLASVYGIVKQSGGTIWVESEPLRGTTFRVFLPRIPEAAPVHPATDGVPTRGTVMLVEDETSVRALLRGVLARAGYDVIAAAGGDEALAASAAFGGAIDLLIADVVLAGMGGRELAARLGVERPGMRVLFVSGYHEEAIGMTHLPADFLGKPFTPATLEAKVREILARAEPIAG